MSLWNRCPGWFPDDWKYSKTCGGPTRTPGSKLCNRCYNHKRRVENHEEFLAKRREYYKNNPQKFKDYAYDDYWKHREERLVKASIYYFKNADKICDEKKRKRREAKLGALSADGGVSSVPERKDEAGGSLE